MLPTEVGGCGVGGCGSPFPQTGLKLRSCQIGPVHETQACLQQAVQLSTYSFKGITFVPHCRSASKMVIEWYH